MSFKKTFGKVLFFCFRFFIFSQNVEQFVILPGALTTYDFQHAFYRFRWKCKNIHFLLGKTMRKNWIEKFILFILYNVYGNVHHLK